MSALFSEAKNGDESTRSAPAAPCRAAAKAPANIARSDAKWRDGRVGALVRRGDKSDARDPHGLRPGRKRPRDHRAAERGDEIAPRHDPMGVAQNKLRQRRRVTASR